MGFINDQHRAILAGKLAQRLVKARIGQDHAGIGHHRLGQDRSNLAGFQGGLDGGDVVEFHRRGDQRQVGHLAQQAGAVHRFPVLKRDKDIVHRAMIAAVEHQNLGATGDGTGHAQRKAVRIGGGGGNLPAERAETLGQQTARLQRVFGGQHVGQAAFRLFADGYGNGQRRMAEHASGIAQTEIVDAIAVDIGQSRARCLGHQHRMRHRPVFHPVQRHAIQPGRGPFGQGGARPGAAAGIAPGLSRGQGFQPVAADTCDQIGFLQHRAPASGRCAYGR